MVFFFFFFGSDVNEIFFLVSEPNVHELLQSDVLNAHF